jgi:hypothetical protein
MNRALKEQNSDSWINGRRRDHGMLTLVSVVFHFETERKFVDPVSDL